jgi:hypothetical protein
MTRDEIMKMNTWQLSKALAPLMEPEPDWKFSEDRPQTRSDGDFWEYNFERDTGAEYWVPANVAESGNGMLAVIERMSELGYYYNVGDTQDGYHSALFYTADKVLQSVNLNMPGDTIPEAVARAALLALADGVK